MQSIFDYASGVAAMILWFSVWPGLRASWTKKPNLPSYMLTEVAFLDQVPWILLIAGAIKLFEMWIILRRFTKKEAEQLAKTSAPSP